MNDPECRVCEQCKSHDPITSACADCRISLCRRCTETHTNIPLLKHHTLVPLQQFHMEACEKWQIINNTLSLMQEKIGEISNIITQTRKTYTLCRKRLSEHYDKVLQQIKAMKTEQEESLKRNEADAVLKLQNTADKLRNKLKESLTLSGLLRLQQELGKTLHNSHKSNTETDSETEDATLNYSPSTPSTPSSLSSSHSYVWSLLDCSQSSPTESLQYSPVREQDPMLNFSPPSPSSVSSDEMNNNNYYSLQGTSGSKQWKKLCDRSESVSYSSTLQICEEDSMLEESPYSPPESEAYFRLDAPTPPPTFTADYLHPEIHNTETDIMSDIQQNRIQILLHLPTSLLS